MSEQLVVGSKAVFIHILPNLLLPRARNLGGRLKLPTMYKFISENNLVDLMVSTGLSVRKEKERSSPRGKLRRSAYGIEELKFIPLLEMQAEVSKMSPGEVGLDWVERIGYGYAKNEREYIELIRELERELKKGLGADYVIRWTTEGQPDLSIVMGDVLIHIDVVPDGTGGFEIIAYPAYRFRDRREVEEWVRKIPPSVGYQV